MTLLIPAPQDGALSIRWDEARKALGKDAIALTIADMDFEAPAAITAAVTRRAQSGNYCYSYWNDDYFAAVTYWLGHRHDWKVDATEIVPVGRMVESLPAILREIVGTGANVVVPYPSYAPIPAAVRAASCNVIPWELKEYDHRYEFDFESLPFLLADAKVLVITNPCNPVGRVWTKGELASLACIAEKAGVLVLSDEFHMDLTRSGHDFCPYLTIANESADAASFTSPGKTFNVAGLETANIIVKNPLLREQVRKAVDDAGCHNPRFFAAAATIAGYMHSSDWLEELMGVIEAHARSLAAATEDVPGITLVEPEGTYLAWLDFRGTHLADNEISAKLEQKALALTPGTEFGSGGSGFMRMNLAVPTPMFDEALNRIKDAFDASDL